MDKPVSISITNTAWAVITAAGQSGTVWLQNKPALGRIVIAHSDTGSSSGLTIQDAFPLPNKLNPPNILKITADNVNDIYYARATRGSGTILTDVF